MKNGLSKTRKRQSPECIAFSRLQEIMNYFLMLSFLMMAL
jgi:hypothetical protein